MRRRTFSVSAWRAAVAAAWLAWWAGRADLAVTLACEVKRSRPRTLAGLRALAAWFGRQAEVDDAHDDMLALFAGTVAAFGGVGA